MVRARSRTTRSAEQLAKSQREISVSEFFEKNRHMLGFDNPVKALMTTVKEGVDNALDACEEAGILADITVEITRVEDVERFAAEDADIVCGFSGEVVGVHHAVGEDEVEELPETPAEGKPAGGRTGFLQGGLFDEGDELERERENDLKKRSDAGDGETDGNGRAAESTGAKRAAKTKRKRGVAAPPENFIVAIQDNGPGIVAAQVGKIFGKLLYGSKFHRLRQSRGQQGIGISAAGMYGQQTTGRPICIWTRTRAGRKKPANYFEVLLDVKVNKPDVRVEEQRDWDHPNGTRVEIEMKAKYQRGQRSVDTYLACTAVANPHVTLRYRDPDGNWTIYRRATKTLPEEPREVKPHPAGVELGKFLRMLQDSPQKKVGGFLQNEFCRISPKVAREICDHAGVNTTTWLSRVQGPDARKLHDSITKPKLMRPPTDCISPIGEDLLIESLAREYPDAFLRAVSRPPTVYRGNAFQVEAALAYGGGIPADGPIRVLRFANRVPLIYDTKACAISKAVLSAPWTNYGVKQSRGAPPIGPIVLMVHLASVWVPFTNEAKVAVADYDEIHKELRRAVMDVGRALGRHVKAERRMADAIKKRDYIAKYIPKISEALQGILEFDDHERDQTTATLREVLDRSRKL
jgi:DNA topoisomerase VI B subunit